MKCPECFQALPDSLLRESVGVCHRCGYRIWIKKQPGLWNGLSIIASILVAMTLFVLNLIPWSFDSSSSAWDDNGIQYGFPFEASRHVESKNAYLHSKSGFDVQTYRYAESKFFASSASANASFAVGATLLTWLLIMIVYRRIWYRHHFTLKEIQRTQWT